MQQVAAASQSTCEGSQADTQGLMLISEHFKEEELASNRPLSGGDQSGLNGCFSFPTLHFICELRLGRRSHAASRIATYLFQVAAV